MKFRTRKQHFPEWFPCHPLRSRAVLASAGMNCPCGLGKPLDACCGPIHAGKRAETAEQLMRARYSAFALGRADFIAATGHAGDREELESELARTQWLRLKVGAVEAGGPSDAEGHVTFTATSVQDGRFHLLTERSRFLRQEDRWSYVDGDARYERLAVGRNEPCPCGSGEKSKACHGR
jgi:SEC-C motif domain protein